MEVVQVCDSLRFLSAQDCTGLGPHSAWGFSLQLMNRSSEVGG